MAAIGYFHVRDGDRRYHCTRRLSASGGFVPILLGMVLAPVAAVPAHAAVIKAEEHELEGWEVSNRLARAAVRRPTQATSPIADAGTTRRLFPDGATLAYHES